MSGGPPPPPAPPGGSFTSRQAESPSSRATPPRPSPTPAKSPAAQAGKNPTPPARGQSPGKNLAPPARGQSPGKKAPPPGGQNAPPAAAGPKKSAPASGTPPVAPSAQGKSPAKRAPTPEAGKKAPPPSAAKPSAEPSSEPPAPPGPPGPPGQPAKSTPAASGQPPLPPGRAPSPKKQPATPGSSRAATPSARSDGSATPAPPGDGVPPVAKKSPAGKKSPARGGAPPKQPAAKGPTPKDAAADAAAADSSAAPSPVAATPSPSTTGDATPVKSYTRGGGNNTVDTDASRMSAPGVSPVPNASQFSTPPPLSQSGLATAGSRRAGSPRRSTAVAATARINASALDRDPRSGLPLISFPADRRDALAHLGNDILLHYFEDCNRISSKGKPLRRIVLVTDQTLFVCEESGSLLRCVQVSKISQVNVATDNSNEIALVIPSEYDIILSFDRRSQRDDILTVLRAVHKRMVSTELNVWHVKDVRPNQYRMEKPPGFQLQRIPQRSRANLVKALESVDANDRERRSAIQRVQEQLDFEHKQETLDKQQEVSVVQSKLDEANLRLKLQLDEMEKLRQVYNKIQRRVEEIDTQYGTSAGTGQDLTIGKDMKIRELHEVVEMLTASVTKANEERLRLEKLQRSGDFDEKDLDFVESDIPRLRGRSLQHQGLIEVLQRQLMEKQRELGDLQSRQVDLQRLSLDLHKKEEQLKELEQSMTTSSTFKDPSTLYSSAAAQSTFDDLVRSPPPAARDSSFAGSPSGNEFSPNSRQFGSPAALLDEVAQNRKTSAGGDEVLLSRGALAAPKQLFSTDIPEFRVPPDERDFKEDPRTGLRFKDLEGPFVDRFPSLQGAIMYFFAVGTKENKRGQSQKRVLIVTDQVVYQCTTGGAINRTFEIKDIREFIRDREHQVALIVEGLHEYDLLMRFKDSADVCQELLDVIQRTSAYNKRNPPLVVKEIEKISPADLRLEKPPTWEYVDRRARPRKGLYRALQQLSKTSASERMRANAQQDELRRDLTSRIREELMPEVNIRREREYVKLRQQLVSSQQLLQEKQLEARNLLRQIQSHKCSVSGVVIQQQSQAAEFFESGSYWIPTDPVVMEAELEILHVQFNGNFIVTSHPNGFLNVWDVVSADLVRTLKINGHTARVTTFYFDAYQVLSGGHDSSLRLWHVMQPTPQFVVHNAHKGAVTGVQFDAAMAVSSGTDGVLHVWEFTPTSLKHSSSLRAHKGAIVGFKMERGFLASSEWGWTFIWDIAKGIVIRTLRDENGGIRCVDLSGNRLITGGTAGVISVWNTATGDCETLHGHADDVHCVALQGHFAVSSSADGSVRIWDTRHGGVDLGVFHDCFPQEIRSFYFKANRFVVGEGTTVKCWTR